MQWRLAEAKNKFSELFNRALAEGPQRVRRRDEEVVVMAARDYERLTGTTCGFKDFLLGEGPDLEELDLDRDRQPMWGELSAAARKNGKTPSVSDGLIAASARRHGLHIMTRNVSDFEPTGAMLINPWEDQ